MTWKDRRDREQKQAAAWWTAKKKAIEPYVLCSCGEPLIIAGQIGSTVILKCSRGSKCPDHAEFAYPDAHPFFNHDQALTRVGGKVKKPSTSWTVGVAQGIPLPPLQTSPPTPQEIPKAAYTENYTCNSQTCQTCQTCQDCKTEIDQSQAQSTANFTGKPLCKTCMGKALT